MGLCGSKSDPSKQAVDEPTVLAGSPAAAAKGKVKKGGEKGASPGDVVLKLTDAEAVLSDERGSDISLTTGLTVADQKAVADAAEGLVDELLTNSAKLADEAMRDAEAAAIADAEAAADEERRVAEADQLLADIMNERTETASDHSSAKAAYLKSGTLPSIASSHSSLDSAVTGSTSVSNAITSEASALAMESPAEEEETVAQLAAADRMLADMLGDGPSMDSAPKRPGHRRTPSSNASRLPGANAPGGGSKRVSRAPSSSISSQGGTSMRRQSRGSVSSQAPIRAR